MKLWLDVAIAQDLEPRRWTPLPVGTNVLSAAYSHTSGDIFFDPVLRIEDAEIDMDTWALSYVHTFSLAGKLVRFDVLAPWQKGRWQGLLDGVPAIVERRGLADPTFRLSLNLLTAEASEDVKTVAGAAMVVIMPWGEYYKDKFINLGENRYVVRPQLGVVHSRGHWSYELTGSIFFYSDNDEFINDRKWEKDPLYAAQAHLVRIFKPRMWASLSAAYGKGGRSTIDGERKNDERANFLSAVSIGFPISVKQTVKIAYLRGRTQNDTGTDSYSVAVSWSVLY